MKDFFRRYPLEVVTGIAGVVVAGVGLALSRNTGFAGVAGSALSVIGASLAAIVSASIFGSRRADESLLSLLAVVRNQLATSSSQISAALSAHLDRGESIETTVSRVDQAVGSISSLLRDISGMLGSESVSMDAGAVIQSKRELLDLGQALDTLKSQVTAGPTNGFESPPDSSRRVLAAIEEMQTKVSEALTSLSRAETPTPERRLIEEHAPCPNCGANNSFAIGNLVGDSQTPTCQACGERFHAHRGASGVFTNRTSAGRSPATILSRHNMRLPSREERRWYLDALRRCHADGRIVTAHDLTNALDDELGTELPTQVRMPLFYALVNREYGIVQLEADDAKLLRDRLVTSFHDCVKDDFVEHADAAWLAQALYRLWGYAVSESEINELCFGKSVLNSEEAATLARATTFAQLAIDAGSGNSENDADA